jgi:hypothetical protein
MNISRVIQRDDFPLEATPGKLDMDFDFLVTQRSFTPLQRM